ncbi:MAG TPA: hypothetical protein VGM97_16390 [Steroidobacteraceae bacterium]|jgi:hypothetical protein
MATIEDKQAVDRTTSTASGIRDKGDSKAASESDAGARNFIKTHDVTKVKRKTTPGAGEEAADLSQAED